MRNLKNKTRKTERFTDTENTLVVATGEGVRGGMGEIDEEAQTSSHKIYCYENVTYRIGNKSIIL